MVTITSAQIRGARAMLGWSLTKLAEAARVSVSTVKCIEDGDGGHANLNLLQDALETEGVRFLLDDGNGPGMRLRAR